MKTFITTSSTRAKVGVAAATLATGALIGVGLLSGTAQAESPSPSSTPSAGSTSSTAPNGKPDRPAKDRGTAVTGDELAKVTAAVKAKDSGVTVTKAFKRTDGSYIAFGTKDDARVAYSLSSDLKTVEAAKAPGKGGGAGKGEHTAVTGAELTKVTAAVKAKDSAVTVTKVLKDADGSYDVIATKGSDTVRYEVSADLKMIEVAPDRGKGGGKGGEGKGEHTAVTGAELTKVTAAVKAKDSAVTVTKVLKDADGSYDVIATKGSDTVRYEVSADLKTIEVRTR